ncbi:MAG: helix-turn-helix transcriptional regulator [Bacteroidetes bacterium]|nr:helix-turn-helix transcriptional regulator [Bacteroidota bacterium]
MFYRKFSPPAHLQSFVECFYIWEYSKTLSKAITIESPPTGFASIVFNYGTPYRVTSQKLNGGLVPKNFLTGQATKSYQLQLSGQIGMVGIVFRPAGLHTLFGMPMYEFSDERTNLRDVLGKCVDEYSDKIEDASSHGERLALLEQFVNVQFLRKSPVADRTDFAANLIVDKHGLININDVIGELYVCRRQFERKFLQKVGVSPKYYTRIRRIGHLCNELAQKRWKIDDWQDLIYHYGYYDQSHFIKDFTEFVGKAPSLYVKNNTELANYLKN